MLMRSDSKVDCFFSSRRRLTRYWRDWLSDVCSSDLQGAAHYGAIGSTFSEFLLYRHAGDGAPLWPVATVTASSSAASDRKGVVKWQCADLGGRRIIKKK